MAKVLIVHDKPSNHEDIKHALQEIPIEVYTAKNHDEALTLAAQHQFSLLLMNTEMETLKNQITQFVDAETHRDNLKKELQWRKNLELLAKKHVDTLTSQTKEITLLTNVAVKGLEEPLVIIENCITLLSNQRADLINKGGKEHIDLIANNTGRIRKLLNSYLEYSISHSDSEKHSTVFMNNVLKHAIENMKPEIDESKAEIVFSAYAFNACPPILGEEQQLTAVFQLILNNAIQYRSEKPIKINIQLEVLHGLCLFSIQDNGIGIQPKYYDMIFWAFKPEIQANDYKHDGIGLAVCRKVIERHGGKIWVNSSPNEGSTFYIALPCV